jgi:hypothetical protein
LIELQRRLYERFSALRDSRQGAVFFVEHGLDADEIEELRRAVRRSLTSHPLDNGWWDNYDLPLLVMSTEVGYRYKGSGTDFWPLLESEMDFEFSPLQRQRLKDLFVRASERFRGVRPPATAWAEAFHLIAWPIAHSLLPLEFHRPLAITLANLRASANASDDSTLYRAVRAAASYPTARFAMLLEDVGVVVSLTRSLLGLDCGELSAEIIRRLTVDLDADDMARRSVVVARSIQRAVRASTEGVRLLPVVTRTRGTLQLRFFNDTLLLEASFPRLEPETAERLRRTLRRRRFAPQLWGSTARVPSDQLLSGLPFPLKLTALPESDGPLFPGLDAAESDAHELAVLHGFELQLAPPHIFAVSADEDVGRLVRGSTLTAHRKYWALIREEDEAPPDVRAIGDVGPLRCIELDPSTPAGARALAQLGYDIRLGVSVRFAGTPPIDRGDEVPTFITGDNRVIVPQQLNGEAGLVIDLDGHSALVRSSEVVRVIVEAGDHRVRVSSETDSREYAFRGVGAALPRNAPVYLVLRSEERTVQALLGGRLSFTVEGSAPIDGLELTVDLAVDGRLFSATGLLGPIPQPVSTEHAVMKALLSEDVRDHVSGAAFVTLRARVGRLAVAAWELERIVRPCWWDLHGGPKLLSENGPLRFGVVSADDPVRAPIEGVAGNGTYLLAPVALKPLEFNGTAPFAALCLAPNRVQLHTLSIAKPRLERRRRGGHQGVGLEDLVEAYLRWSLAETRNAIGDLHRRQVTTRLEEWITEICCGQEWTLAETSLPGRDAWGILEQVCQELSLGRDDYLGLSTDIDAQVRRLAIEEIRRSIPALWARVHPPSDLDDDDYEALDRAFATAYETLAARYRMRGRKEVADELGQADPGESPDKWEEAFSCVCERIELRALAAMLLPSNSAARLMALEVGEMTVDDVADELVAWALSARRAFAGAVPSRDVLRTSYALWIEPAVAVATDWRTALDTLLAERTVARATRYLALKAREARWGTR